MREQIIYLDSSALVKRYIKEPGSDLIRRLYLKAYSGEATLSINIWNIGEVLGALDRARRVGRIDDKTYDLVRRRFLLETRRLMKLGSMLIAPLRARILRQAWKLIEKYHIYEADAIQVVSAKHVNADSLLTGDKRLHEVAADEGLNSKYLG